MNKLWIKIALPVLVLGLGVAGMSLINATAQQKEDKEEVDTRPTVSVDEANAEDYQVMITSFGEVRPLEMTKLSAQVSGEVMSWHPNFVAGGVIPRGTTLFSIDKQRYEAAVLQAEAELNQAQSLLIEEQARARVAAEEAKSMEASQVTDLYLRKPQLMSAQAAVKSAEAKLKLAKRDLSYCDVKAPYDALVVSRTIGLGQFVSQGTQVGEIYNIETAEVTLPIAGFDSRFLPTPLAGTPVTITSRGINSYSRQGTIDRDLGMVEKSTRMSQVVARIEDPYSLRNQAPVFKFGSYVEVSMAGQTLQQVYRLPQDLVTNRTVWLVDKDMQLQPVKVDVLREEGKYFLINDGLSEGDKVITTVPEYPQKGMKVKVAKDDPKLVAQNAETE
ncbi:efflux RND transporter periplasmic adaptor subunit [Lacimicrobium sp. SS2-24]|uniref:efflux RND transporter periplasmic adaptor subunit n=1 Tax=Lacimicrobium sp. SS2-24 TaxID=2005569 RepID=UPI000B4B5A3D|nr:efflux RND transporter periplasmic adaptor subunit [Lacimicrobium sp. SS2-24]